MVVDIEARQIVLTAEIEKGECFDYVISETIYILLNMLIQGNEVVRGTRETVTEAKIESANEIEIEDRDEVTNITNPHTGIVQENVATTI